MKYKVMGKQNNSVHCVVCGIQNPFCLNGRFYELDTQELACTFQTRDWHQSYPGRTHGGITAAVLDELIGRAICINEPGVWGVTVELSVKYKKQIPTEADLKAIARVTKNNRKLFEGTGQLLLSDGTVAAEAWGKYMKMPLESISAVDFTSDQWYLLEEDDPEEIEI